jgi:3-oxoacyl-[acyl-carrier-protein] synthase-3
MASSTRSSVIIGTGCTIPKRVVTNEDFLQHRFYVPRGQHFDPADTAIVVAKFKEITDISERRYATPDQLTSDLALAAAREALTASAIDPETLDYIVVAHNFGDVRADNPRSDLVPTLAARVKQQLEIRNPFCVAYDLPFGCPGWLQALIQVDYFLRSGDAQRALVIGAEILSRVSDPHDRDSMLYADGAGAVVVEAVEGKERVGILAHATRSDTLEHARLLWMDTSYNRNFGDDRLFLKMHGHTLYEYALATVPAVVRLSLERCSLSLADVSKVLLHQANAKMDEAILRRLFRLYKLREVPEGIMPMTISWLGNSSVATLPTLLDLIVRGRLEGQRIGSGDVLVFASVGAGMNINSVVYRWP